MGILSYILQQTINALSLGSIYALVAIGLSMVYGVLRLVNFAHGDLMMVACYVSFFLVATGLHLGFIALLIISIFIATLVGILMERIAYRPVRGADEIITLLTSLAVSIFIENIFVMFASPVPRSFRSVTPAFLNSVNRISGGIVVPNIAIVIFGVTILLFILLHLFVTRTKLGISMRATSEDLMAAQLSGININIPIVTAFTIGSAIAGLAGILWAARIGQINPLMGFFPLLKSFVAVVIGGMGSLAGAILGSYLLGFAEIFFIGFLPPVFSSYRDAFVFLLLIIVLLLRPSGIFGSTEREKV
jgi:branched-chain amino acid transport system permease protein